MKKRRYVIDSIINFIMQNRNVEQIKSYKKAHRREPGYNYAQYGNLLISSSDVRDLYIKAGYKARNYTDEQLWQMYLYATGDAIDELLLKKM